jgi:hypothetical protein
MGEANCAGFFALASNSSTVGFFSFFSGAKQVFSF